MPRSSPFPPRCARLLTAQLARCGASLLTPTDIISWGCSWGRRKNRCCICTSPPPSPQTHTHTHTPVPTARITGRSASFVCSFVRGDGYIETTMPERRDSTARTYSGRSLRTEPMCTCISAHAQLPHHSYDTRSVVHPPNLNPRLPLYFSSRTSVSPSANCRQLEELCASPTKVRPAARTLSAIATTTESGVSGLRGLAARTHFSISTCSQHL